MATHPLDDDKPNTEERYTQATHASNLRVQAERGGSADMLIAAGWSESRVGASLIRLHSEWEGLAKPSRRGRVAIESIAKEFPKLQNGMRKEPYCVMEAGKRVQKTRMVPNMVPDMASAHRRAHEWYLHDLKLMFQQMKTLPEVRQQLALWARQRDIADADHRVAEILGWWLDHVCPVCDGLGKDKIPGTPSLSHKDCKACHGTGETRIPAKFENSGYQRESKMMLGYIHDCLKAATTSIRQQLPRMRQAKRFAAGIVDTQE